MSVTSIDNLLEEAERRGEPSLASILRMQTLNKFSNNILEHRKTPIEEVFGVLGKPDRITQYDHWTIYAYREDWSFDGLNYFYEVSFCALDQVIYDKLTKFRLHNISGPNFEQKCYVTRIFEND